MVILQMVDQFYQIIQDGEIVNMEEKIVLIYEGDLWNVNNLLSDGWKVKMIAPIVETASAGRGRYGAYVVLERSLI